MDVSNPCFECGMCCQYFRVSFYHGEIAGNGVGTVPEELTARVSTHLACMKGTEKGGAPCIALRYAQEEGYRCSIYENRSSTCRAFNVLNDDGSPNLDCQRLRNMAQEFRGGLNRRQDSE